MPRSWRFRLQDMIDAATRIERYVGHSSWSEFAADSMVQEAVAYNLIVTGEAAACAHRTLTAILARGENGHPWDDLGRREWNPGGGHTIVNTQRQAVALAAPHPGSISTWTR